MNEQYVSRLAIAAAVMWGLVGALMVGAWVVLMSTQPGARAIGLLLATSGCALSAFAAVLSIRRYAARICGLIRNLHGVNASDGEGLRVLR